MYGYGTEILWDMAARVVALRQGKAKMEDVGRNVTVQGHTTGKKKELS